MQMEDIFGLGESFEGCDLGVKEHLVDGIF